MALNETKPQTQEVLGKKIDVIDDVLDEKGSRTSGYVRGVGSRTIPLGKDCSEIPDFWSPELDKFVEEEFFQSDLSMMIWAKAVSKLTARDLVPVNIPDIYSDEDTAELVDIIDTVSQGGLGVTHALRLFYADMLTNCRGGFMYVLGSSELVPAPDTMSFAGKRPEMVAGQLKPLEDVDGNLITLSSGTPIYGVGVQHLDARRIQKTSNIEWPVIYKIDGKNIPLHQSRIISYVDSPSSNVDLNGIGRCPALRGLRSAMEAKWNFDLIRQISGDGAARKILIGESGITIDEMESSLSVAYQSVVNGSSSLMLLAKETDEVGSDPLKLSEIDLKRFPIGHNQTENFTILALNILANFYLAPADIGISSILRSAARSTVSVENQNQRESGIPEIIENVNNTISDKLLPDGLRYVPQLIAGVDYEEQIATQESTQEVSSNYMADGVISALTSLELLNETGALTAEQFEREKLRISSGSNELEPDEQDRTDDQNTRSTDEGQLSTQAFDDEVVAIEFAQTEDRNELAAIFFAALNRQYRSLNIDDVLSFMEQTNLDIDDPNFINRILPAITANTQALKDDEVTDFIGILSLLLLAGKLGNVDGIRQGNRDLSALERLEIDAETNADAQLRLYTLFSMTPTANGVSTSGGVRDARLPNGLDTASFLAMAYLLRSAIQTSRDRGKSDADSIRRDYNKQTKDKAESRGKFIANNEYDRGIAAGSYVAVKVFRPSRKEWLRTTAQSPREDHLQTVGEIVPFNSLFSNGLYWSGEVPNCQCGIQVHYA